MLDLLDFIKTYFDVANTGNTPENKGQCVGLVSVWMDNLGIGHEWGNAKDLLNDADPNAFTIIQNTPDNIPSQGDVFVFGDSYGAGNGHTGLVVFASVNLVTLFEQNDGLDGGTPQLKTYNYAGALGWLHPNLPTPVVEPVTIPSTPEAPVPTPQTPVVTPPVQQQLPLAQPDQTVSGLKHILDFLWKCLIG